MAASIGNDTAKALRRLWFDYLDTVAPHRARLHAYCLKLTGSVWDAEDLVQETLLRGFATIGRGDLHGETSPVASVPAYLARTATNFWIDTKRRRRFEVGEGESTSASSSREPAVITASAGAALFDAAPQERAALVLKEVFDFNLKEIADLLSTTIGTVKSALHRGRQKLAQEPTPMAARAKQASPELIDRFIAAFNARDVPTVTALLLDGTSVDVWGVGGGRGRANLWITGTMSHGIFAFERHVFDGETVIAFVRDTERRRVLGGLVRLEESDGHVSRIVDYHFCPETLGLAAAALGLEPPANGYHQGEDILPVMIATTDLPWRG